MAEIVCPYDELTLQLALLGLEKKLVDKDLAKRVNRNLFDNPIESEEHLFLSALSWHWHNSSNKDKVIIPGSKFDRLQKLTMERLKARGIE